LSYDIAVAHKILQNFVHSKTLQEGLSWIALTLKMGPIHCIEK